MNIKVSTDRGKTDQVLKKLVSSLKTINILHLNKPENYITISYNALITIDSRALSNLKKKILKIKHVKDVMIFAIKDQGKKEQPIRKRYAFFIDIDGTITEKTSERIDPRTRKIFRDMRKKFHHRLILASGRPNTPVEKQMEYLKTTGVGIAENGSVIIGIGGEDGILLGDLTECEAAIDFLKKKLKGIDETGEERRAEGIITRKYSADRLNKLLKNKYDVICTDSGTSIHINCVDACKGHAIKRILNRYPSWPHELTVGIGDSDLDVSMFKAVAIPLAVKNANNNAKMAAKCTLNGENLDGVIEAFRTYEPRLTLDY